MGLIVLFDQGRIHIQREGDILRGSVLQGESQLAGPRLDQRTVAQRNDLQILDLFAGKTHAVGLRIFAHRHLHVEDLARRVGGNARNTRMVGTHDRQIRLAGFQVSTRNGHPHGQFFRRMP